MHHYYASCFFFDQSAFTRTLPTMHWQISANPLCLWHVLSYVSSSLMEIFFYTVHSSFSPSSQASCTQAVTIWCNCKVWQVTWNNCNTSSTNSYTVWQRTDVYQVGTSLIVSESVKNICLMPIYKVRNTTSIQHCNMMEMLITACRNSCIHIWQQADAWMPFILTASPALYQQLGNLPFICLCGANLYNSLDAPTHVDYLFHNIAQIPVATLDK